MGVRVADVMQEPAVVVDENEPIEAVARTMLRHRTTCVGVVDADGRLVGVIREEEFAPEERYVPLTTERARWLLGDWVTYSGIEQSYAAAGRTKVAREVMASRLGTVAEHAPLREAMPMLERGHCLLVVRGERPVGVLTRHDLLKLVAPDRDR